MRESFSNLWSHIEAYKLEIVWLLLGVILVRALWRLIKKKQGPDFRSTYSSDQVKVPLKYRPEWGMLIMSSLLTLVMIYGAIENLGTEDFRDGLTHLGVGLLTLVGALREGVRSLSIQITDKGLEINYDTYKAKKLAKVELWDDLVYLKTVKDKEVKIWLNYKQEHFPDMVHAVGLIEKFCRDYQILLENHFDPQVKTNTTFNKEAALPKSLKERWEEFKKIPPYEKLPD